MKSKILMSTMVITTLLSSCATTNSKFWVSGVKVEQSNGAGKSENYMINRSSNPNKGQWENFYSNIEGFEFKPGVVQHITVNETKIDPSSVPADASSIKYKLEKVKDSTADNRYFMHGAWVLATINNNPINRMVKLPTLNINVSKKMISGNDGCNNYSASVKSLGLENIELAPIAATKKACLGKDISLEYYAAWEKVTTYTVENETLTLKDKDGNSVLSFIKAAQNDALNGSWTAIKIEGGLINKMTAAPTLTVDTENNQISGNNSCNVYNGQIAQLENDKLKLGNIVATQKMCFKNEVAERYMKLLEQTSYYKIDNELLVIYDQDNNELLRFIKS